MDKYNTGNQLASAHPLDIHHECHNQPDLITRSEAEKMIKESNDELIQRLKSEFILQRRSV